MFYTGVESSLVSLLAGAGLGGPARDAAEEHVGVYQAPMAMLPDMLKRDRERWGMSVGETGWRLGIMRREYIAIEDGERPPNSMQYEAICEFFG
jgi:hypothetical protein